MCGALTLQQTDHMRTLSVVVGLVVVASCGGSEGTLLPPPGGQTQITDADVFRLSQVTAGSVWYKNSPDTLARSAGSGHSELRLRTRFNARAASQLDASGKVRAGTVFQDSSIIVKELINGSTLIRYAVMMKLPSSSSAGTGGWLWAYYSPTGSAQISISSRGGACVGCHSSGIDQTRMNDSHP